MGTNPEGLEFERGTLDAYLKRAVPDLQGDLRLERVPGGQSNPTFFITYRERRLVLRKQPPGDLLPSAHAVDREYRISPPSPGPTCRGLERSCFATITASSARPST